MKINKKVLSLLLALVMVLGTFSGVLANQTRKDYDLIHVSDSTMDTNLLEATNNLKIHRMVRDNLKDYNVYFEGQEYSAIKLDEYTNQGMDFIEAIEKIKAENSQEQQDPAAPVDQAKVESVEIENYRRIVVRFNTVVDKKSAEKTANYYFELVDGFAGKLGAKGDITKDNSLANIELSDKNKGWWDAEKENIVAEIEDGKTIVKINLPEDSRFERNLKITGMVNNQTRNKRLRKDVKFNFAVRDIKDATGKRTIDTFVTQLVVRDDKRPELVDATILERNIKSLAKGSVKLVFNEPLENNDANDRKIVTAKDQKVKVYVNGKLAEDAGFLNINKAKDSSYDDARELTLNLGNHALISKATPGTTFDIAISGVRDLAGNLYAGDLRFTLEITEAEITPEEPAKVLEISEIRQVLDNVLRIEANQVATLGESALIIEGAAIDADGKNIDLEINTTGLEFKAVKVNDKENKYFAYVAFDANFDKGADQDKKVNFQKSSYLEKDIKLISKADEIQFKSLQQNLRIELDQQAPKLVEKSASFDGSKISIPFVDVYPEGWATDAQVGAIQAAVFQNKTVDYKETIRIEAVYTNTDDKEVRKLIEVDYTDGFTNSKLEFNKNDLVINLTTDLPEIDTKKAASFTVELPRGVASDDYEALTANFVSTVAKVEAAAEVAKAAYIDESGRTPGEHGYTSIPYKLVINHEEEKETKTTPDNKVPQTSKKLIAFDGKKNELLILVSGLPTVESVKNTDNYILGGKTLTELGVKAENITFVDARDVDVTEINKLQAGLAIDVASYKAIRIALPKNSIEKDGAKDFVVKGLRHADGALMVEVEVVVDNLKDNTAPTIKSVKVDGERILVLTFDEPVKLTNDATISTSAARNFNVSINGKGVTVEEVRAAKDVNTLQLVIANTGDITDAKIEVEVVLNPNEKMEISDLNGNELEATAGAITN